MRRCAVIRWTRNQRWAIRSVIGAWVLVGLIGTEPASAADRSTPRDKKVVSVQDQPSPTSSDVPGARTIRVLGDVGVHPLDRQAACQEAEQNALTKLYKELDEWAQQLTGRSLSPRQLVVEHAWLLGHPDVQQTQQMSVEEKPYGLVARQEITLVVPTAVLAQWAERLQDQKSQRMVWVAGTVAATVLAWLLGLVLTMNLDRATGAYYRRSLLLVMVLILGILTGVGWWLVWRMMYY